MDKVQKIRAEIERLKGWNNNVRNSTRHMTLQEEDFNRGKHSSYLEILDFIDSLQEESISEDNNLRKASEEYLKVLSETPYNNTPITNAQTIVRELITFLDIPSKYNPNHIEEPVREDLPHIRHRDTLDEFAYQCAYDLSNDWAKETPEWKDVKTACKLGAQWQKEQFEKDYTNLCNGIATAKGLSVAMAYDKGMADAKEQMMAKAVDAKLLEGHLIRQKGVTHPLHVGDKVKIVVIKEN